MYVSYMPYVFYLCASKISLLATHLLVVTLVLSIIFILRIIKNNNKKIKNKIKEKMNK